MWYAIFKYYANKKEDPKEKGKIDKERFKSNLTTTLVVLLFMIHTNLVQTSILGFRYPLRPFFYLFRCKNLGNESGDEVEYYLESDLDVKCWEGMHLFWVFAVALPALVFWGKTIIVLARILVIGIPLFAYRVLKKNKHLHENQEFKSKFGFLYDGYKKEQYYW